MVREPEVIVRAQHQLLAFNHDVDIVRLRDRLEIGIEAGSLDFARGGKVPALVEECHLGLERLWTPWALTELGWNCIGSRGQLCYWYKDRNLRP